MYLGKVNDNFQVWTKGDEEIVIFYIDVTIGVAFCKLRIFEEMTE